MPDQDDIASRNPDPTERGADAPTPLQRRILWRAITGVAIAVISALVVGAIAVVGNVLGFLQPVLVPLAVAGILAYLLDPVVRWARAKKFFGRDLTRLQAVLLVFFLTTAAMALASIFIIAPAVSKFTQLFDRKAKIVQDAERVLRDFNQNLVWLENSLGFGGGDDADADAESGAEPGGDEDAENPGDAPPTDAPPEPRTDGTMDGNPFYSPETGAGDAGESSPTADAAGPPGTDAAMADTEPRSQLWGGFLDWLKSPDTGKAALAFLGKAANGFFGAMGYIVGFFLVPVYLFFFLKDASAIRDGWKDYVPLRNSALKTEVVDILTEVNGYLIAYFRGQVLVSLIDGALTGIILTLMGLDYAIVIGVSLAVLGIIPFVGFIVTAIPAVLIAASQSAAAGSDNPLLFPLAVGLVFIAVQQIDGIFVQPKIVGDSVGLHPLTVIFSVLFWSLLIGGILGALLAVPLTAAVKVLFRRFIWEQKLRPNVLVVPEGTV